VPPGEPQQAAGRGAGDATVAAGTAAVSASTQPALCSPAAITGPAYRTLDPATSPTDRCLERTHSIGKPVPAQRIAAVSKDRGAAETACVCTLGCSGQPGSGPADAGNDMLVNEGLGLGILARAVPCCDSNSPSAFARHQLHPEQELRRVVWGRTA